MGLTNQVENTFYLFCPWSVPGSHPAVWIGDEPPRLTPFDVEEPASQAEHRQL